MINNINIYKTIFDKVNDAIFIYPLQPEGFDNFLTVNKIACKRYGYSIEEFQNISPNDISKKKYVKEHVKKTHREALLGNKSLVFETIHYKKSGEQIPVEVSSNVVEIENELYVIDLVRDISERITSHKLVEENREKFHIIFQNSPDAIALTDFETDKFINVNPSFCEITGYTEQELLESRTLEHDLQIDLRQKQSYKKHLNNIGFVRNQECTFQIVNGEKRIGLISGEVINFGMQKCVISIIHDITNRERSERALRASEIKLRETLQTLDLAQETAKIGTWWFSVLKKNYFWTLQMYDIFGFDINDGPPSYKKIVYAIHPEDRVIFNNSTRKLLLQSDKHIVCRYRVLLPDSTLKYVEQKSLQLLNEKDQVFKVIGTLQDITERKLANEQLIEALENNKATLKAIPDIMFEVDEEGYIVDYSIPENQKTFLPSEKFFGKKINMLLPENDFGRILQAINEADKNGWCRGATFSLNIENEERWYELSIATKNVNHKKRKHYLALAREITERIDMEEELKNQNIQSQKLNNELTKTLRNLKKLNKELNEAKIKAEESDRLKTAFLANISHEIRTPMNGILGFITLLKEKAKLPPTQVRYLSIIENSSGRLFNIINNILDIARIETGQIDIHLEEFDIEILLAEIYNDIFPIAKENNIDLYYESILEKGSNLYYSDKSKIRKILESLLDNALKYTRKGEIGFGCKLFNSQTLIFHVSDTGEGMVKNENEHIFNKFMQGNREAIKINEGAGLGLSISKAYVEKLGGKIWFESEYNKGSVFYFTLPFTDIMQKEKANTNKLKIFTHRIFS